MAVTKPSSNVAKVSPYASEIFLFLTWCTFARSLTCSIITGADVHRPLPSRKIINFLGECADQYFRLKPRCCVGVVRPCIVSTFRLAPFTPAPKHGDTACLVSSNSHESRRLVHQTGTKPTLSRWSNSQHHLAAGVGTVTHRYTNMSSHLHTQWVNYTWTGCNYLEN
jgi:hypothetical protein